MLREGIKQDGKFGGAEGPEGFSYLLLEGLQRGLDLIVDDLDRHRLQQPTSSQSSSGRPPEIGPLLTAG
jgi:hypothetical protein